MPKPEVKVRINLYKLKHFHTKSDWFPTVISWKTMMDYNVLRSGQIVNRTDVNLKTGRPQRVHCQTAHTTMLPLYTSFNEICTLSESWFYKERANQFWSHATRKPPSYNNLIFMILRFENSYCIIPHHPITVCISSSKQTLCALFIFRILFPVNQRKAWYTYMLLIQISCWWWGKFFCVKALTC